MCELRRILCRPGGKISQKRACAIPGAEAYVHFAPLGPVLAIMPWNFPFWQALRCALPAIMAGNSVLLRARLQHQRCFPGNRAAHFGLRCPGRLIPELASFWKRNRMPSRAGRNQSGEFYWKHFCGATDWKRRQCTEKMRFGTRGQRCLYSAKRRRFGTSGGTMC